jgi:ABC-2 type transport system permease protein
MSSLTSSPVIAAVSTFGMLLLLWIMQSGGANANGVTAYLSLLAHFSPMLRGLINTTDLIYFALFITIFVVLSIRQMDSQRLQN